MSWFDGLRHKIRVVLNPAAYDRALDEELRFHQELAAMNESDRTEALRKFGNRTIHKEATRGTTWLAWFDLLRQDTGYAWRSIRRTPGTTAMIVITLALGIGVNATVFTVTDQLFLRNPAGVTDPDGVRRIWKKNTRGPGGTSFYSESFTFPAFRALAEASGAPERFAVVNNFSNFRLGGTRRGASTGILFASGNYFTLLGVRPALGRFFTEDEARPGVVQNLLVLSHHYWRAQLAGDSAIVGRNIKLDTSEWTVIGVAPEGFFGADQEPVDVWAPLGARPGSARAGGTDTPIWDSPRYSVFRVFARFPREASVADFERRGTSAVRESNMRLDPRFGDSLMTVSVAPIQRARGPGTLRTEATISTRLQAVAFIVLIIACANVVNLLLARAVTRRREIAVRLALGISRNRLVRLITIESVLLALVAAAASLLVANWGGAALRSMLMSDTKWVQQALGGNVVWSTIAVALACGLIAGIIPALQYSRPELTADLKDGGRGSARNRSRLRDGLVIAQAALSVTLIVGAALLVRTLQNVEGLDIGYDAPTVLFGRAAFEIGQAPPADVWMEGMRNVEEQVRSRPGVAAAGRAGITPMGGFSVWSFYWGSDSSLSLRKKPPVGYGVSAQFFTATGMRMLQGTTYQDGAAGAARVVINSELASLMFPDGNAVGQCMRFEKVDAPCSIITGVVSNARRDDIIEVSQPMYYLPLGSTLTSGSGALVVVRAKPGEQATATRELAALIKQVFPASDPNIRPMTDDIDRLYKPWRLGAQLFTGVGVLALLVALVGIYSTVSYSVGQRAHEFGVRAALGAKLGDVLNQVVGEGVRVVAIGIGLGVVLSMLAGRLVRALLYGVEPTDLGAMILAGTTLLLVTVVAAIVPAWRAGRADPVQALRRE